jgi:hypothetical protein
MRARIRLAAIVVGFACSTGVAHAGGPGGVYNDFAQDGKLSCSHSRADLRAVLRSGSINQYGDPYTLARLKLAVRRQLAGGCREGSRRSGTAAGAGTTAGRKSGSGNDNGAATKRGSRTRSANPPSVGSAQSGAHSPVSTEGSGDFAIGRALLAVLLVGGLALGGWLTKRALAARH